MKTWVVISDLQIEFHDKPVVDLVVEFVKDIKPYGIVMNGDIVDCYVISDFDKSPEKVKKYGLTKEIAVAGDLMHSLRDVPRKIWVGGNHEDRWRRVEWRHPNLKGMLKSFPEAFHMKDYGFEWVEYGGFVNLGKLTVTHGSIVRQHSGQTGKAHMEKYGTSILVGHCQRLGAYYKRDVRGSHVALENGCLCRLDPEYDHFPNWQQGFTVVHVAPNGYFHANHIPIINRESFFYGPELYTRRKNK